MFPPIKPIPRFKSFLARLENTGDLKIPVPPINDSVHFFGHELYWLYDLISGASEATEGNGGILLRITPEMGQNMRNIRIRVLEAIEFALEGEHIPALERYPIPGVIPGKAFEALEDFCTWKAVWEFHHNLNNLAKLKSTSEEVEREMYYAWKRVKEFFF